MKNLYTLKKQPPCEMYYLIDVTPQELARMRTIVAQYEKHRTKMREKRETVNRYHYSPDIEIKVVYKAESIEALKQQL